MSDDLDAIRRVLAGDVESFRRLVERYQRPLLALVRNLTPPDSDHEGVAQEVLLAAFRRLAWFDPKRAAFSTWLFTIARNRCRNELARRRPVTGTELPDVVGPRSPDRAASGAELFRQLGDDLWRRRADVEVPADFADRVMDAVRREPPPSKGAPVLLLSSPALRVAACVLACLACLYRTAAVVAVFFAR